LVSHRRHRHRRCSTRRKKVVPRCFEVPRGLRMSPRRSRERSTRGGQGLSKRMTDGLPWLSPESVGERRPHRGCGDRYPIARPCQGPWPASWGGWRESSGTELLAVGVQGMSVGISLGHRAPSLRTCHFPWVRAVPLSPSLSSRAWLGHLVIGEEEHTPGFLTSSLAPYTNRPARNKFRFAVPLP